MLRLRPRVNLCACSDVSVNYGEVYGRILRDYGADHAHSTMSALTPSPIEAVDATAQRALQAADVKAKYKLYYVDSFVAALAIEQKATLVTSEFRFSQAGPQLPCGVVEGLARKRETSPNHV